MSDIYTDLSRLLDGELGEDAAEALRARIEADPELSAVWEAMSALPDGLSDLPTPPPPPALDAAVLRQLTAPKRVRWPMALGALAAAALALLVLWPTPPGRVILLSGQQLVEGDVVVETAAAMIAVDGRALISVEPADARLRDGGQEVENMNASHLIAAAAGAVITIAVYEGSAVVSGDTAPVTLSAGDRHTIHEAPERQAVHHVVGEPDATAAISTEGLPAEVVDYIAQLERENQVLHLERNLQEGALEAVEGTPQSWDDREVADAYQPESFDQALAAALDGSEDLELIGTDCEEYPCLAVIRSYAENPDWHRVLGDRLREGYSEVGAEKIGMGMWIHQTGDDEGAVTLAGIAVSDPEDTTDDTHTRTAWRMDSWLADLSEGEEPVGEDEDVVIE
ncbi:MAG: hypothetical protein ACI8RZ_001798 [Myxococcota bacterium]|jgi:hypothetical protein